MQRKSHEMSWSNTWHYLKSVGNYSHSHRLVSMRLKLFRRSHDLIRERLGKSIGENIKPSFQNLYHLLGHFVHILCDTLNLWNKLWHICKWIKHVSKSVTIELNLKANKQGWQECQQVLHSPSIISTSWNTYDRPVILFRNIIKPSHHYHKSSS